MNTSKHKIFLDVGKYIYKYQFRFLKNIIKTDTSFTSTDLKEYIDKFIIYNLISDIELVDSTAASLIWSEPDQSIAFQFPEDGRTASALAKVGYDFSEVDGYYEDEVEEDEEDWI